MTKVSQSEAVTSANAAEAWKGVRESADIQFQPLPEIVSTTKPQGTPFWSDWIGDLLEAVFGPLGKLLGMSWPVFKNILIGGAGLIALFLLWVLVLAPLWRWWQKRQPSQGVQTWQPERTQALALLEEADKLAAEHRYADAVHVLLQRSVEQIRTAQPKWLTVASTAREIAVLPQLPAAGRDAFWVIAQRVERALYALRDLDAEDWQAARRAYAEFAELELPR